MTRKAEKKVQLIGCRYCGASLKWDVDGPYCPTPNCQWALTGTGIPESQWKEIPHAKD